MSTRYYKTKKSFKRENMKGIKISPRKRKTKSVHMLVNDAEIFLKKKKTKSENIVASAMKIYLEIANKN